MHADGLMSGWRLMDVEVHVHDEEDAVWADKRHPSLGAWPYLKAVSEEGVGAQPCLVAQG